MCGDGAYASIVGDTVVLLRLFKLVMEKIKEVEEK